MEKWTDIAEAHFDPSLDIEITSVLAPKKRPPNPSRFKFEKVNEATWKLTNGDQCPCLAWSVGWIPRHEGYRVGHQRRTECVACSVWRSNLEPTSSHSAKAEAMAMAKGACGDYVVSNPIAHLNGLTAILLERE